MTQDYRVSLTLSRRCSKSRTNLEYVRLPRSRTKDNRTGKETCGIMQKHAETSRKRRKTRMPTGGQNADYLMAAHGAEHADSYSPSRSLHSCIGVVNGVNIQSLLISSNAHLERHKT